ncbi:MAG: hypothetical protein A3K19_15300 [Lentisphaerae bacterium RIFOXYB12_FULL_65_16]|nr:MAG: hypothetical protein A3K18_01795 [Lentisphaerae bacterium RIFOXYA12_64_32]OGV88457.1 MAG: hypothetical protein A3K19_15300 [Lentisphaerae bacterium RIFOXYB12_FULL_65_16]
MMTGLGGCLHLRFGAICVLASLAASLPGRAQPFDVPLKNASFEDGAGPDGVPAGWNRYGALGEQQRISLIKPAFGQGGALLFEDTETQEEMGLEQLVPAKGGVTYEVTVQAATTQETTSPGNVFLQLRFLPSNQFAQTDVAPAATDRFEAFAARGPAPDGTTAIRIYLYTHRDATARMLLDNVKLVGGVPPRPEEAPIPELVPPVQATLKDLCVETPVVRGGAPSAVIVAAESGIYAKAAGQLQAAIRDLTGATVPIVSDADPRAAVPMTEHLIVLGNRSTNRTISALYDLYYTLLDLKYPGPEGYALRSLHNPFANGKNVLFVGGSDTTGVEAGAQAMAALFQKAKHGAGELSVGWVMETRLGNGVKLPERLQDFETWDASVGYRSIGYFGWNSLSKRMAMYFMAGDETQAKEFVRLAFPDAAALKEIDAIDEERLENKNDPLAGAYHYNCHLMVLYWDLIEESPFFTDEQRLRITNALARQLAHDDYARKHVYRLRTEPGAVADRHSQWSAVCLYCLGRYFQKYYPAPVWDQCVKAGTLSFAALHRVPWVSGESDNLFWYSTGLGPTVTFLVLSGDKEPVTNGVLQTLLFGQEVLLSGKRGDSHLNSAALSFLHMNAYLTGDGRWIYYRERQGQNIDIFRLGQSFWPPPELKSVPPSDLCNRWGVHRMPTPMWKSRGSGLPEAQAFQFASFRSAVDETGDLILLDGYDGASRNPYHTFALLNLRIDGTTLLEGYLNQVLTKADGMVEPAVAMDSGLVYSNVLGRTAIVVGEVPRAAFCNWRRILAQRVGRFALVVDDLTYRGDSENMEVTTLWATSGAQWAKGQNAALFAPAQAVPAGWTGFAALKSECRAVPDNPDMVKPLQDIDIVLLRAEQPGPALEMTFKLEQPTAGEVYADFLKYADRGMARVLLDDVEVAKDVNLYSEAAIPERISLGRRELAAGPHRLRVEATGQASGGTRCFVGLRSVLIRPDAAAHVTASAGFALLPADVPRVQLQNGLSMKWTGPVRKDEHGVFFNLIARADGTGPAPECLRVGERTAVLRLPQPALATVGEGEGLRAEFALLAEDHLHGWALTQADVGAPFLRADSPVHVDWDFTAGRAELDAPQAGTVRLAVAAPDTVTLDGKAAGGAVETGLLAIALPTGRHVLENCRPPEPAVTALRDKLAAMLQAAAAQRAQAVAAVAASPDPLAGVPEVKPLGAASLDGAVTDFIAVPGTDGTWLCAAVGKTVQIVKPDGTAVRSLQADANIRVLRWWAEHRLLLAGCVDEKVIAFDDSGARKWVFTSEMDPAVYQAAKQYWFKSAPGHEGIHGLYTGEFLDGKSQCFVGSACTLEIIDGDGKLVKRLPVFWGPCKLFELVDGPDGSRELLIAQWPNGSDQIAVLKNTDLTLSRRYYSVPSGQTFVGGWSAQNRVGIAVDDLDGDGKKEVVAPTNGIWNRVTVFTLDGKALANAQFGPGASSGFRVYLRDFDLADLDGNGKKEILVASWDSLLVALDAACNKVWARRLTSPPTVVRAGRTPTGEVRVLAGCEDGTVAVLDAHGTPVGKGRIEGRPAKALLLTTQDGNQSVAIATLKGSVAVFPMQ